MVNIELQGLCPKEFRGHYAAVPWESHVEIHKGYTDTQTAEEVARRGGFGLKEAVFYYKWKNPVVYFSKEKAVYPKTDTDWIKVEYKLSKEKNNQVYYNYKIVIGDNLIK